MVLPASVRSEKLRALRADETKVTGSQKLFYKGNTSTFDVYQIDLDWLIYNRHNGRIESEMLTWEAEHQIGPDAYDDEIHKRIEDFIWNTNVERNKHTLNDLKEKQQQRPGIVSLDGVIIDGNRRAMLLGRLSGARRYFEAVILPDEYYENEKEIVRLETQYQIGEDAKLDYGPLEKYLKVKRLKDHLDYDEDEIADMMSVNPSDVQRLVGIMALMDEYLDHIQCPGLYSMLKEEDGTKEGMFVDLYLDLRRRSSPSLAWPVEDLDFTELKAIQFDYVRCGTGLFEGGKDYRKISHDKKGEKSFFGKEEIWKAFRDEHYKNVGPITEAIPTLDEYMAQHPDYQSRSDAAAARENEWKEKAGGKLFGNYNRHRNKLEAQINANKPRELLERAVEALRNVDYHINSFVMDAGNEALVKEINSLAYEMKRRFDRPNRR
jgi:hypothetical protein